MQQPYAAYNAGGAGNAAIQMLGNPQMGSMPGFAGIWPQGVGITDREFQNPDDCSCPPMCYCWTRPIWFASSDLKTRSPQAGWRPNICMPGWWIRDADVLGQKISFEGREVCGVETCYEPEVHVYDSSAGGEPRKVGHIIMKMPCCACSETEMALAKDARGTPRFARIEHPCCPAMRYLRKVDNECIGWWEYQWPVKSMQMPKTAPPIAQIVYRFHYCFVCHPIWVGFRQIPGSLGPDDQKLLLGMAIVRLWRSEQEQRNEQQNGMSDGNPVY
jgi:hypothetical protein